MGWHEHDYIQTLKFLDLIPDWGNSKIFVPGVGTSGLIDVLLEAGAELALNDISSEAIEIAKRRYIVRHPSRRTNAKLLRNIL